MSLPYSVKRAKVALGAATANQVVVAALTAPIRRIRVLAVVLTAAAATTVKLESAATDLTTALNLAAGEPIVLPPTEYGWCETAAGEALEASTGAAAATIDVIYVEL